MRPDELADLGNYDLNIRKRDAKAVVDSLCSKLEEELFQKKKETAYKGDDSGKLHLSIISDNVEEIEKQVAELKGPHFTKGYRTLSERCTQQLEKLDILIDRSDLRDERLKIIQKVKNIAEVDLPKKVHPDGVPCPECEIQRL